jgi:hypothetical protein
VDQDHRLAGEFMQATHALVRDLADVQQGLQAQRADIDAGAALAVTARAS